MEYHDSRISEINQRSDDTESLKKYAEETLEVIYDDYRKMLAERIKAEIALAEASRRDGNSAKAERHQILADVWQSLLNSNAISSHSS